MFYENELIAHKLLRWETHLNQYQLPTWDSIPDIGLYMDQVVLLLKQELGFILTPSDVKDKPLTASTINNYVRLRVMPAPVKKKYYRRHIAYLVMILTLKQGISMQSIQKILPVDLLDPEIQTVYSDYVATFHQVSLLFTEQIRNAAQNILTPGVADENAVGTLVMQVALSSGFSKIMTGKIIALQGSDPSEVLKAEQESDQKESAN
ncbi:MAG: DUF1836 domain-containing protein [Oscillospiraceae bacterium]